MFDFNWNQCSLTVGITVRNELELLFAFDWNRCSISLEYAMAEFLISSLLKFYSDFSVRIEFI